MTRSAELKRRLLRERLARRPILVMPGCGDALGARLVEQAGFEAVYVSGYCVEGSYGFPDVGFLGMSEVAARAAQIAEAVDVPVLCDGDTGYGNAVNVVRTVREFERAGVAALQLEDQSLPKKCGSMSGKQLVSVAEMTGKIKAATDTRRDANFMIIGRTDAAASEGIDAAVERLLAYAEAGADLLMMLGPYSEDDVVRILGCMSKPFIYLNSESRTMPIIPSGKLETLGAAAVAFPITLLMSATRAMQRALDEIRSTGTTDGLAETQTSWSAFNDLVGLETVKEWERRYIPASPVG